MRIVTNNHSPAAADPVVIDLQWLDQPGVIAAYLLAAGHDLTLIETGPGSTIPALLNGIRPAGYDPAAVTKLIVTHIHLDHAGARAAAGRTCPRRRSTSTKSARPT